MENQLTYSQKRRLETRSSRYIDMTNAELRQENKKPVSEETAKRSDNSVRGKMISNCLSAYLDGNEIAYNSYSDRIKETVQTIYKNAVKENNIGFMGIMLERFEGKVKDVVDITSKTSDLSPDQEESKDMDNKWKSSAYEPEAVTGSDETPSQAAQIGSDEEIPDFKGNSIQ